MTGGGRALAAAAAVVVLTWLLVPPTAWTVFDEQATLSFATRIGAGQPFPLAPRLDEVALPGPRMFLDEVGREIPEFAPGWPALLAAPLAWAGPRGAFAVTFLLHLLGALAAAGCLRRLGQDPAWACLYLLHPTALVMSRGAMSDVPAMAAMSIGLWAWLDGDRPRRGALIAGLVWGASVWLRWSQGPLVIALLAAAAWTDRQRSSQRSGPLLLGVAPWLLGAAAWNLAMHGQLAPPTTVGFSLASMPGSVAVYALWLSVLYPGVLLAAAWRGRLRVEAAAVLAASLVVFGAFEHRYSGLGAGALVVGLRFFLPATVFLLPAYAAMLERALGALGPWGGRARAVSLAVLVVLGTGIQARHHEAQEAQRDLIAHVATQAPGWTDGVVVSTNDARELLLALPPGARVVPWFKVRRLGAQLATQDTVWLIATERADRPEGDRDSLALQAWARRRWTVEEVVVVPPRGATPGLWIARGRDAAP